jgi:cytochrome c peroxidase
MAAPADAGTGMPTIAVAGITEARAPTAGERAGIVTAAVAASATAHATPGTPDVGSTPAKTFTLRGIKESPPYFHDGRLLTLEESVEFFDLVLELKLDADERHALVAFPRQL